MRTSTRTDNRKRLLFSLIPIAVPLTLCLLSVGHRAANALFGEPAFGNMTVADVRSVATKACVDLTGTEPQKISVSHSTAFSDRRKETLHEWDATCELPEGGQYLIRINADSRMIFAINRLDWTAAAGAKEAEAFEASSTAAILEAPMRIGRATAQAKAQHYLTVLGISLDEDEPRLRLETQNTSYDNKPSWNLTYNLNSVKSDDQHTVSISINAADGSLVNAWNARTGR